MSRKDAVIESQDKMIRALTAELMAGEAAMSRHYVTAVAATSTEYLIACRCGWTSQWGSPVATAPLLEAQRAHSRHLAEQTRGGQ